MLNEEELKEEDEEEEVEDEEYEELNEERNRTIQDTVETLQRKRVLSSQRPSTIVHVNTGALEVN